MRGFSLLIGIHCLFSFCTSSFAAPPPKTLVFTLASEPKSLNAMIAQETSTTTVTGFLFEGLTRLNPVTGEPEPSLAENWEVSPEGLVWTFHLRRGVEWFDGVPFTAKDVLFTFNDLIYNPQVLASARDIFTLEGKTIAVEAVDDQTVRFKLPSPFAPFLIAMGQSIFPAHILKKAVEEGRFQSTWGANEKPENIIGTGPFKLKKYKIGEQIELVRNEHYWRKGPSGENLPYLERILLLIVPSPDVRLLKFLEGETDFYGLAGKDYPVLAPLKTKKNFQIVEAGPALGSDFLVFNQNAKDPAMRAWFRSRNFRQAVSFALDRASMIDIIFNRLGVVQCSPLSPSIPFFYNPDTVCYDYDPAKSKKLLAEDGFEDRNGDGFLEDKNGRILEFVLTTNAENPERIQMAGMVREDLSRLGMKVHLLPLEFNSLVSKLVATGDWDLAMLGLTGESDPHFGVNVWRSEGNLHFWNRGADRVPTDWEKRVDEIFAEGLRKINPAERKKLYDEWQRSASEELPLIFTVLGKVVYAVRDRFDNLKPTVLGGPFHNIEEIKTREP